MIQPNQRKLHNEPERLYFKLGFIMLIIIGIALEGYLFLSDITETLI